MAATTSGPSGVPFPAQDRIRHLFPLPLSPGEAISERHIHADLSVQRLNDIHDILFMARATWGISSLHSQRVWGRNVIVCEDTSLHLLWYNDIIYIKPIPLYLLDRAFFDQHISKITGDTRLLVNGFLESYRALIRHPSDVKIATAFGLLPETFTWDNWVEYVDTVMDPSSAAGAVHVNIRYQYGEINLRNVNWLVLVFFRGIRYHFPHGTYRKLLRSKLATIVSIFSIVALALTAMQVLVGIQWVSIRVQKISYWFAIVSLWFLVAISALLIFFFVFIQLRDLIKHALRISLRYVHTYIISLFSNS
ncbi:hypothetical protein GP486_000698 [Trichoglossum hirsutum]|uniref:Uncharacterized protein n=1 Tax=Trichoglossum hirsutum TaxID=265104 RepID=A0A9P8LIA0_9PEZI|nr:hypothetical protein GP486_000698 [Trichoglossum hirsutum]